MSGWPGSLHGLVPMQAPGALNRPISLQPFGQWSFRAVCGVAALVDSLAIDKRRNAADRPKRPLPEGLERNRAIERPGSLHGHEPMQAAGPPTHPDCAPTRPVRDREQALSKNRCAPHIKRIKQRHNDSPWKPIPNSMTVAWLMPGPNCKTTPTTAIRSTK